MSRTRIRSGVFVLLNVSVLSQKLFKNEAISKRIKSLQLKNKRYLHSVWGFLELIPVEQKEELRGLMCTRATTVKASISARAVKPSWV